jgi:hypothetical protein
MVLVNFLQNRDTIVEAIVALEARCLRCLSAKFAVIFESFVAVNSPD